MLTYALPGSLVMAESLLVGASLLNIFLAVWFVNARLYPMAVSLFPLMMHKSQPKWKYYLSCHFVAVSAWLIMKNNYKSIDRENRIDYWIGVGTATWTISIVATIIGYISADYLNKDIIIGLAIVNPVYFFCMLIGSMKNIVIGSSMGGWISLIVSLRNLNLISGLIGIASAPDFVVGEWNRLS